MQISRAGRAMPPPGRPEIRKAAEDTRQCFQRPFISQTSDLQSFADYCRKECRAVQVWQRPLSLSASLGETRRGGGQAAEAKRAVDAFRAKPATLESVGEFIETVGRYDTLSGVGLFRGFPPVTEESWVQLNSGRRLRMDEVLFLGNQDIGLDVWEVVREELFLLATAFITFDTLRPPRAKLHVVPERGWKCRSVSTEEWHFGVLSGIVGATLLEIVDNDPHRTYYRTGTLKWGSCRGRVLRSLDLKNASDMMPQDLCLAGMRGICDGLAVPLWFRRIAMAAVGPRIMRYPDGLELFTQRGTLMGNPVTWPLLSLYVSWVIRSNVPGRRFHAICGDDALVSVTWRENSALSSMFTRTGAVMSVGKDFATREGYGVFMEQLINPSRHHRHLSISIRALTGFRKGGSDAPSWMEGPSLHSLAKIRPDLLWYLHLVRGSDIAQLMQAGLDPFAPRWVGGGGFPGRPSQRSLRIARMMYSQNTETLLKWIAEFESLWSSGRSVFGMAWDLILPIIQEFSRPCDDPAVGRTVKDFVVSFTAQFSTAWALCFGHYGLKYPALKGLSRNILQLQRTISSRGYWVPHEYVRDKDIVARLKEIEPRFHPMLCRMVVTPFVFGSQLMDRLP